MSIANSRNKHKDSKHKWLIYATIALAIPCVIVLTLELTGVIDIWGEANRSTEGQTAEEKQSAKKDAQNKQQYLDKAFQESSRSSEITHKDNAVEPNASLEVSATQNGESIVIVSKINNTAEGACDLTISNGTKFYSQSASVIYQDQFSSCAGFSVPIEKLGVGTWVVTLSVSSAGGNTLQKTTELEVK